MKLEKAHIKAEIKAVKSLIKEEKVKAAVCDDHAVPNFTSAPPSVEMKLEQLEALRQAKHELKER